MEKQAPSPREIQLEAWIERAYKPYAEKAYEQWKAQNGNSEEEDVKSDFEQQEYDFEQQNYDFDNSNSDDDDYDDDGF